MTYNQIATPDLVAQTKLNLEAHGFIVHLAATKDEAKSLALSLIPEGSEVMTMSSVSLAETGIDEALNNSGKYNAVRDKLYSLDRQTQAKEMKILGSVHDYVIGSVQAITTQGEVVVASATGSQIPAYAYCSNKVIWIVGTQKITTDLTDAMKRLHEYVLPLESERAHKAYGVPGSSVNKVLIYNKESIPDRIHIILVSQVLGY
ncbi:MAG: lactate utilization protein [bacterium]